MRWKLPAATVAAFGALSLLTAYQAIQANAAQKKAEIRIANAYRDEAELNRLGAGPRSRVDLALALPQDAPAPATPPSPDAPPAPAGAPEQTLPMPGASPSPDSAALPENQTVPDDVPLEPTTPDTAPPGAEPPPAAPAVNVPPMPEARNYPTPVNPDAPVPPRRRDVGDVRTAPSRDVQRRERRAPAAARRSMPPTGVRQPTPTPNPNPFAPVDEEPQPSAEARGPSETGPDNLPAPTHVLPMPSTETPLDPIRPAPSATGLVATSPFVARTGVPVPGDEERQLADRAQSLARNATAHRNDPQAASYADPSQDPENQLQEVLGQQFDLRQRRYLEEIQALEAKVQKLKDLVQKRQDSRDEIIEKRLNQLMSEAEGLGW